MISNEIVHAHFCGAGLMQEHSQIVTLPQNFAVLSWLIEFKCALQEGLVTSASTKPMTQ